MTRLTLRHLALAALVTLPGLTVLEAARADAPPFSAQGTWADCNIVTSLRQTGPLLRIVVDISQTFTGTLDGGYVGTEDVTVFPDGTATFTGEGTFTGAVDGETGRAAYRYEGTVDAQGVGAATWSLDKGTDGLEKLRGNGTFSGTDIPLQLTRFTPADPTVCDGGMYGGGYQGALKYTTDSATFISGVARRHVARRAASGFAVAAAHPPGTQWEARGSCGELHRRHSSPRRTIALATLGRSPCQP